MKKIYFILLLGSLTSSISAQEKTKVEVVPPQNVFVESKKNETVNAATTPYGNSAFSNIVSNISLSSVLNNGENAKIELKYTAKNSSKWWFTPGLTVDQKLGKNDKKASFYDFNKGISPGTTVGLNLQAMYWNPVLSDIAFKTFVDLKEQYAREKNIDARTVTYMDMMNFGNTALQQKLKSIKLKTPIFFNFKFSFTKTKFAYATDSVSLKKTEETHLSPDIGIAIGTPVSNNNFIALSYVYSESYESADELSFSRKFGTTTNTFSQTLAFGKPTFKKDHKIISEFRQNFGEKTSFAIAPSIAYGLASKKAAFTLPIYFIQGVTKDSKPNGLQGGVNLGYVTATDTSWSKFKDGFGAQLILTAPFSIFGSMF